MVEKRFHRSQGEVVMDGIAVEIEKAMIGGFVFDDIDFVAFPLHPAAEGMHRLQGGDAVVFAMQEKHGWNFTTHHFRGAERLRL